MNHTISCPGCGRAVDIPDGMDACFCTFCGTKVARPASPAPSAGEASPLDAAALAQELAELMVHRRALAHQFERNTYEPQFRAYQAELSPLVIRLESALADRSDRTAALEEVAAAWLDALAQLWTKGSRKNSPHYEDQHLMAVFTIPALRDLPQPCGEELAKAVQAQWVARWPKTPIGLGSYQEITDEENYQVFDAMGVPRTTDGHFEKGSEAPYSSDGMVTFGQAIREGKMDVWTDDFQKLTGQQPMTVLYMFQHSDQFQVGERHSKDN